MSIPMSTIKICAGVRLTSDYKHTIWFADVGDQLNYFAGKVVKTFSAYTFLRKSWSIKVEANMETARQWTYLYFMNGSGKTYYYFINNIEYIADNTIELFLELDVIQTFLFDFTLSECFVEREHSSTDAIGDNIIEESLELGDLRVIDESFVPMNDLCVLVLSTFNPITTTEDNTDTVLSAKFNGMFSGLGVYAVSLTDWQAWGTKLKQLDEWGKSDGIVAMWMYPKELVNLASGSTWDDGEVTKPVSGAGSVYESVGINDKLSGGYTPRNKKLFTYPFNFIYATNNSGSSAVYRYERFGDNTWCNFKTVGALSPEGTCKMYPINYNGVSNNYDEGFSLGGFPTCAWNEDVYKLWLAQNQNTQNLAVGGALMKIAGGVGSMVLTGGLASVAGAGATVSGISSIFSLLASRADKAVQPPQAKGQHSASVNVVAGFQTFTLQRKSVGIEQARIIDDYFDMYGYQTNRVKVPNTHVRANWTYTKTIDCHVTGLLCSENLRAIENVFNKGVTFWTNGDNIGLYGNSNSCL